MYPIGTGIPLSLSGRGGTTLARQAPLDRAEQPSERRSNPEYKERSMEAMTIIIHHASYVDRRLRTTSRRAHSPSVALLSPAMHLQTNNRRVNPSQDEGFVLNPITTRQSVTMTFPQRARGSSPDGCLNRKSGTRSSGSVWVPSPIRRLPSSTFTDRRARSTTRSKSGSPGTRTWSLCIRSTESLSTDGEGTCAKVSQE